MARTSVQALVHATRKMTTNYSNWCLKYVREAYGIGAKYPSAISAWNGAKRRHSSLATAPEGAPVFFSHPRSRYGHVALLDRINGVDHIRTTNSAVGRPVTQPISLWTKNYGYRLLGWTEDLNGVSVAKPVSKSKSKPTGSALGPGSVGPKVGRLQSGLRRVFPAYAKSSPVRRGSLISIDNSYGPQTEAWVRIFQERTGLKVDGWTGPITQAELAKYGIDL